MAAPAQILEFDRDTLQYGEILQRSEGKRSMLIRNTGEQTLEIYAVLTTCGCTAAELDKMKIAAGESARLSIEYDTRKKGKFLRFVLIKSNALNTDKYGEMRLPLTGTILKSNRN